MDIKPKKRKRNRIVVKNDEYDKLPVCGIEVRLPVGLKPYPSQKLIIVRIITALKNSTNVLAESPTGSGKTMALLASTCAWLRSYQEERKMSKKSCKLHSIASVVKQEIIKREEENYTVKEEIGSVKNEKIGIKEEPSAADDDEMESTLKQSLFESQWIEDFKPYDVKANIKKDENGTFDETMNTSEELTCTCLPRVRIYYGTRTHKQISQVVKEFGRLPYNGILKHTILASREQTCINGAARKSADISQFCKDINSADGLGCSFKSSMRNRFEKAAPLRSHLENNGTVVFDTDALVDVLSSTGPQLCPYFCSTRVLTQDADIIFCPFSYLVDPIIRNSSDVHMKNSIIILDEAHNIEDTCRDAASFSFTEKEFEDSLLSFRIKRCAADSILSNGKSNFGDSGFDDDMNDKMDKLKSFRSDLITLELLVLEIMKWMRCLAAELKSSNNTDLKTITL
ncbi:unnamed protein product [Caenorhabditis bovis]|uniref:Helicase ATP-binding domain-containing protein n=1 Tax=Caenorhabditis bovis TaxID=2654633 RepID=A0A8S1F2M9_9PELO|nr:unnamed protein product [Caenorhabditis bovis]